jgi:AraC-like DNA-binding protein/quercetin dioxygenase-like cupin family protein
VARRRAQNGFDLLRTPPRVAHANFYPFAPGEGAGPHYSESDLFLVATDGAGRVRVGTHGFEMHPGQLVHVPWAVPVRYEADARDPFVLVGLHLVYRSWEDGAVEYPRHFACTAEVDGPMTARPSEQPFQDDFAFAIPRGSRLVELALAMASAFEWGVADRDVAEREWALRGLALAFVATLSRERNAVGTEPSAHGATPQQVRVVREVASFMEHRLTATVRRGDLARRVGMSESSLAAAFRAVTGRGPIDYLIDLRIARAQQLLRGGRARVGQVGARVGIPDVYHFSRIFKTRVGCSPLEYRRRLRVW